MDDHWAGCVPKNVLDISITTSGYLHDFVGIVAGNSCRNVSLRMEDAYDVATNKSPCNIDLASLSC